VPATSTKVLDLLRAHGIQLRQLTAPMRGVEQFSITENTARPPSANPDFFNHAVRSLQGQWGAAPEASAPSGAWVVPMNQPLARLAFYLLAPTSGSGASRCIDVSYGRPSLGAQPGMSDCSVPAGPTAFGG